MHNRRCARTKMVFIILFSYFAVVHSVDTFILPDILNSCFKTHSKKYKHVEYTSKLWNVSNENFNIVFNVCEEIPEYICGKNVSACLMKKSGSSTNLAFDKFHPGISEEKILLRTMSTNPCKSYHENNVTLTVKFECHDSIQEEPKLNAIDDCDFELIMMSPDCSPRCTTRSYGHFIDLRPLTGQYFVETKTRNFSIALCKPNPDCAFANHSDYTSCEVTNGMILPFSSIGTEITLYNGNRNGFEIHGKYKGFTKKDRKFELILKCQWESEKPYFKYNEVANQGKTYKFEMLSRYGCIKLPPSCEIYHGRFIYNLTNLHKSNGFWEVSHLPDNRKILLNICGPLVLPSRTNNHCSAAFSQVCDVSEEGTPENYINLGSVSSRFEITYNDVITTAFVSGEICKNDSSIQHHTQIDFTCSAIEEGPKFVSYDKCHTILSWNTPTACPRYIDGICDSIRSTYSECSVDHNEYRYNLSSLHRKYSSYSIKDDTNNSLEYILNVCGPIVDRDAPCMKNDMVAVKHLGEINVKNKVNSLGKMKKLSIINNAPVIEMTYGSRCGNGDYHSAIYFECADKEEVPRIKHKTECYFEFKWRTPAACPMLNRNGKNCIFEYPHNSRLINFAHLKKTSLKLKLLKSTYVFDLCGDDLTNCSADSQCKYVAVNKNLLTYSNKTYMEFSMNNSCDSESQFNKTIIELVCDQIVNNDHFTYKGRSGCILKFELKTHLICYDDKELITHPKTVKHEVVNNFAHEKEDATTNDKSIKMDTTENKEKSCLITNPYTLYQVNLSSLRLNISFSTCPNYVINPLNGSVILTFDVNESCQKSSGESKLYEYVVLLKCSEKDRDFVKKKNICYENITYERTDVCKLLLTSVLDNNNNNFLGSGQIAAISVSVIAVVLVLIGLIILGFIKYRKCKRRQSYDSVNYEKDADL